MNCWYNSSMEMEGVARRLTLPLDSASVPHARGFLRESLRDVSVDWNPDVLDDAMLLMSEVVTNALQHAGTEVDVSVHCTSEWLRVEVTDGSPSHPVLRDNPTMAGTGRGIWLLDELAARWGIDPEGVGKVVWFELSPSGDRSMATAPQPPEAIGPATAGAVTVTLLNVPLLMHAAWQIHAETLLREHMLATLSMDGVTEQLETHAAAHAAMTVLLSRVPVPDLGDGPNELMAAATEPHVSASSVILHLDTAAVHDFDRLDWALTQAWDMAHAGQLLNPPMQPELWMFRRWLCREVAQQARGHGPQPWTPDSTPLAPPVSRAAPWDTDAVNTSTRTLVAADDTNALVAVSPSALDLLGYDNADQLLGKRLVTIIPPRYHQAHLAGFSMHLSVDRSPLLDRPVTVPALRCDGSEVLVELTITSHRTSDGRTLFVGDLVAAPDH